MVWTIIIALVGLGAFMYTWCRLVRRLSGDETAKEANHDRPWERF
jgi:hypothetical protein